MLYQLIWDIKSLFFREMDAQNDDNNQKDDSQDAEKYKFVFSDSVQHRFCQFATFSQIIVHPPHFLPVVCQPPRMIDQLLPYIVTDVHSLVHHPHPILQLVGGVGYHLTLCYQLCIVVLVLLSLEGYLRPVRLL